MNNYKIQNSNFKSSSKFKIQNKRPLLFGIVQGSVYKDLRIESAKYIASLGFDGIAVGGVSVGEGKKHMYEVIRWVAPYLSPDKAHYLMGVGEPEDLIFATKYGFDMFDCVLPTRLARHGTVWIKSKQNSNNKLQITNKKQISKFKFEKVDLRNAKFRNDKEVLDKNCDCYACKNGFSRGYLSHLVREKEMLGLRLLTLHNLRFLMNVMREIKCSM